MDNVDNQEAGLYSLSSVQMDVWMDQMLHPDLPHYNIGMSVEIKGILVFDSFRAAIERVCSLHDALRLRVVMIDGMPRQKFVDEPEISLSLVDLRHVPDTRKEAERLIQAEMNRSFDLDNVPLWSCTLYRVEDDRYIWLSRFHHLACDGTGCVIFYKSVCDTYTGLLKGGSGGRGNGERCEDVPSYREFIEDDQRYLNSNRRDRDRDFWRSRYPSPPSVLFTERYRSREVNDHESGLVRWAISRDRFDIINKQAVAMGGSAVAFFLSLLAVYFSRAKRTEDVVIGVAVRNRSSFRQKATIGMFSSIIPVNIRVDDGATFSDLVRNIGVELRACYRHQRLPISDMNMCTGLAGSGRERSHDIGFSVDSFDLEEMLGDIPTKAVRVLHQHEQKPFSMSVNDYHTSGDVMVELSYGYRYLSDDEADGIRDCLRVILDVALESGDIEISDFPLLSADDRKRVLQEFNDTTVAYSCDALIHELFEAQVDKTPGAVAVVYENEKLTYAKLNARANQLAHRLRAEGVGPDVLVAINAERSLEMVVGLLGILKAGGAYVPMDPDYPQERIIYMLRDSEAPVLLTQHRLRNEALCTESKILFLDEEGTYAGQPENNLDRSSVDTSSRNLAYVIYTSGSTGIPKGVMNEHRGVVNRLLWMQKQYQAGPDDRFLQKTSFSFDVSVWEFFWPLLEGARLVVLRPGGHQDTACLSKTIESQDITVLHFVPSMLQVFLDGVDKSSFSSVRHVMCSGEALSKPLMRKFHAMFPDCHLHNQYGPTESGEVTSWICDPDLSEEECIPIGRPIANTRIFILDEREEPVPVGIMGEIHIGGDGVARGYLNRPDLTEERFVPDPFSDQADARMYRTGDLGRWQRDGSIEYLGRNDDQVKIRGFRIELGEIEARLLEVPGVRDAVVLAREDVPGDKRLVAYWTEQEAAAGVADGAGQGTMLDAEEGSETVDIQRLRDLLRAELPGYMVPSAFVKLGVLPLTPNGKVDKKALPAPDASALVTREYEEPLGQTEEVLAGMWQKLLSVEKVGRYDNFFDLGGHSLLAVQLLARMRQVLGQEISLKDLFEAPTLAEVAARLQQADESLLKPIERTVRSGPLSLSWSQQRLWLLEQMEDLGTAYHIPVALRLQGKLEVAVLQKALATIVSRHEVLRTVFVLDEAGEEPRQVIKPAEGFALKLQDLSRLDEKERSDREREALRQAFQERFDLSRGPLIRGMLLKLKPEVHVLLLEMHHIVSDGWSIGILVRELSVLYEAFWQGRANTLPELVIQYADYARWQRQWMTGERLGEQLTFWKDYLQGVPELLELPTDHPRPAVQSHSGAMIEFELDAQLGQGLRGLAKKHGATLFMVLQAGWSVLLSRLSGQDDVVIGTPIANRRRSELEELIGFFVNTLALRTKIDPVQTVSGLLQDVRQRVLAAFGHQDVPFEQVVEALHPDRSLAHSPLFQVMLVLRNAPEDEPRLPGLVVSQQDFEWDTTHFDLTLSLSEQGDGRLVGMLEYCTDLFDRDTLERWLGNLRVLLAEMVADDTKRVGELSWLTVAESRLILEDFNATKESYPEQALIHELFEAQVEKTPEAVAVVYEDDQLTYAELNARSNRLAHRLRQDGVGPDVLVAISVNRSLEMVVGLLGILKAGGAYVPVDPALPQERVRYMLGDSAASLLLTKRHLLDAMPKQMEARVLLLDEANTYADQPTTNLNMRGQRVSSRNLAYVVYTSGSTGSPKGVMLEHRGLVNLVKRQIEIFGLDENSRLLQFVSFSFDVCVSDVFSSLCSGATLYMGSKEDMMPGKPLCRFLEDRRISHVELPVAVLGMMDSSSELPYLKTLVVGGEACPPHLATRWGHGRRFINAYGPTEATVCTTVQVINEGQDGTLSSLPIGKPIANTRIYILDTQGKPVPVGVKGEIHIGGDGVARGYLNRTDLTEERFVSDPFSGQAGARMYRTGDLGRWREDGAIEYLGRDDFQVKIRGLRIELGEIEARILEVAGVHEAVVVVREDQPGDRRLVAYWKRRREVDDALLSQCASGRGDESNAGKGWSASNNDLATGRGPSVEALRNHLKESLPAYMVPSAFVQLEEMPLTPNGKVDRKALPVPDQEALPTGVYQAPRGELEEKIAKIWAEVLGLEKVGVRDNFFDAGGNSLIMTKLHGVLEKKLGLELSVMDLFQYPSVASLGDHIQRKILEKSRKNEEGDVRRAGPNPKRKSGRLALRKRKQHLGGRV